MKHRKGSRSAAVRPRVLALLCSARRNGYTAGLLEAAANAARSLGVEVELASNFDFRYGPCTSCFWCVRDAKGQCNLDDDFGRKGRGSLVRKLTAANGLILADPVHMWGESAGSHLFAERCYPFVWNDGLNGMPFVSMSCASNQGMHRIARQNLCKFAFTLGLRYLGGLAVHCAYYEEGLREARVLGRRVARAASRDSRFGRKKFSDEQRFLFYADKPWKVLPSYLDNLTNGTFEWRGSMVARAMKSRAFRTGEAAKLLERAGLGLRKSLRLYRLGREKQAMKAVVEASADWTHATWKEFLETKVIGIAPPSPYRPRKKRPRR